MSNWKDVKKEIDREIDKIMYNPPEEVVKTFKHGLVANDIGSYGQYFAPLVFIEGDCRALAYYNSNNLCIYAEEDLFELKHLKVLTNISLTLSAEFLGYCGFDKVWEFAQEVINSLDTLSSKEDFKELIGSYNLYVGQLHTWIHHYFPWNLGVLFPKKTREELLEKLQVIKKEIENV